MHLMPIHIFLKFGRNFFRLFSKKSLFSIESSNKNIINDHPLDKDNYQCIQNTPRMFCEFISYFLYNANITYCSSGSLCHKKDVNIKEIVSNLYETLSKKYHGFNEICKGLNIIDYLESEK